MLLSCAYHDATDLCRSATKGWYIDEQIGKEDVLDKLREGREATIGAYGYPLTDLDEKVEVDGEFCLVKVRLSQQRK